jgi:uncharacterized protein YbjQ (UPF0145 family)
MLNNVLRRFMAQKPFTTQSQKQAEATQNALLSGTLPDYVFSRIEAQKMKKAPFTSNVSVKDFLLQKKLGMETIGLAMGNAHFKQYYEFNYNLFEFQLDSIREMVRGACDIALKRLRQEALAMGADAVIATEINFDRFFTENQSEFVISLTGTAVRFNKSSDNLIPVVCTTSMAEFCQLLQTGVIPIGIAFGISVYDFPPDYSMIRQTGRFSGNQEVTLFQSILANARSLAHKCLHLDTLAQHGKGVLAPKHYFKVYRYKEHHQDGKIEKYFLETIFIGTIISPPLILSNINPIKVGLSL